MAIQNDRTPTVEGEGRTLDENSILDDNYIVTESDSYANRKGVERVGLFDPESPNTVAGTSPAPAAADDPALVRRFMELWRGGDHAFGQYTPPADRDGNGEKEKGRYRTVKRAPTEDDFRSHLRGEIGLGIVPINRDGLCWWGGIDLDDTSVDHSEVVRRIETLGLPLMVTRSKSGGFHAEFGVREPIPAKEMRERLLDWSKALGIYKPALEIFPKQTELGTDECGSILNLPYFGGDSSQRFGYRPIPGAEMERLCLTEYLDYAEKRRVPLACVPKIRPAQDQFPSLVGALVADPPVENPPELPVNSVTKADPSVATSDDLQMIPEGNRHNTLVSLLGRLLKAGISPEAAEAAIRTTNDRQCVPPIDERELEAEVLEAIRRFDRGKLAIQQGERAAPLIDCVYSARDLVAMDLPPLEWLIKQIIVRGSINMLYGWRGCGKTFAAMQAAIAVASGAALFGEYDVPEPRNAVFIDGEMRLIALQERLKLLCNDKVPEKLYVLPSEVVRKGRRGLNLNDPEQQDQVMEMLIQLESRGIEPGFLGFDNLSSLSRDTDENSNSDLDGILDFLITVAHRGYGILLVHHAGKSGTQRGASRKEDHLETVIKLEQPKQGKNEPPPEGAKFDLTFEKHRNGAPSPYTLSLELGTDEHGRAVWLKSGGNPVRAALKTLYLIYKDRPRRQKDMTHKSESQISKDISYLRGQGWLKGVTVTPSGEWELADNGLIEQIEQDEMPF